MTHCILILASCFSFATPESMQDPLEQQIMRCREEAKTGLGECASTLGNGAREHPPKCPL